MSEAKTESVEFRQQVRMAAVQVAGLRPDELAQALAYEVEPMSGIPAPEAEVSYQPVVDADPTVRVYDVVVKRRKRGRAATGGPERWLKPAILLACIVCGLGVADGVLLVRRQASLARGVAERRPLQAQLDQLHRETKSARDEATTIRNRREAAVRAQDEAAAMRVAYADLLAELAAVCGDQLVIASIAPSSESQALTIKGVGVTAEAIAEALRQLTVCAVAKGWRVTPGSLTSSDTGATVAFQFDVARSGK